MKGSLYNHPRVVWLILVLILVAGWNAWNVMPRLEDPHMESRVIQVKTFYPGADAERVEAEITEKLERKMREIPEVDTIKSVSRPGLSTITLELEDRVDNAKPITARLRDKVAEVTDLPNGASDPDFSDTLIYAHSAIISLTWHSSEGINYAILGRYARELENRLRNLNGTDFVDIIGLPSEEIRVELDDATLASHGLTMNDVADRIRGSDARGAAGVITGANNQMVIQVSGALDGLARMRRIPITYDEKGASLRLGDIATVNRTYQDPPGSLVNFNGTYGVAIAARMFENNRIDHWSDDVKNILDEIENNLPASIHLTRVFDQKEYAEDRLNGLLGNLGVGAIVVIVVLLVSLGYKASLITASILPLTLMAALAITNMFGMRIEQMLVVGLIVALGIMVDNAIVITDEIQHLRLKGVERSRAVATTVRKLWLPLLGSTLTTIIAFLPLVLMPGNAGDFMIGIPGAVIASLIGSYAIAFTIISAVAGRLVDGIDQAHPLDQPTQRIWWRDGINGGFIANHFEASLKWAMNKPVRTMIFASAIPIFGFVMAGNLTEQFFPVADRDQFRIQIFLPSQATIYETKEAADIGHAYLKKITGIKSSDWYIAGGPSKYYYNIITNYDGVPTFTEAMVTVKNLRDIPALVDRLQREFTNLFPEAMVLVRELGAGPPITAPIEVKVIGPDLAILQERGDELRRIISKLPHVTNTQTTLKPGRPMISVEAREDDVSVAGLTLSQVEHQLAALTTGIVATHLIEETQQVPVRVIVRPEDRADLQSIADMNLMAAVRPKEQDNSFADLPVSAIADVELTTKVGTLNRLNGQRVNNVRAYLEFGILPATAFTAFEQALKEANFTLPAGYKLEFGGEKEGRDKALTQLFGTVGLLIIIMLLCIVLTFNSFRLAFVTFAAALQAGGLGMLSLWLFDYPLSFVVIIGLVGLIGLAINAAIVILSELRGMEQARSGEAGAVVTGVMKTGRHIISTTLTTVGGFMPLVLAGGSFWPPFAVAISGGAFLSMIVSFYFAPAAFLWVTRMKAVSAPSETVNANESVTKSTVIAEPLAKGIAK